MLNADKSEIGNLARESFMQDWMVLNCKKEDNYGHDTGVIKPAAISKPMLEELIAKIEDIITSAYKLVEEKINDALPIRWFSENDDTPYLFNHLESCTLPSLKEALAENDWDKVPELFYGASY
jgi:hypothetical protein